MDDQARRQIDMQNWAKLSRSILNGVVGDYLEKENNPLAIEMAFYHQDQALDLSEPLAAQMHSEPVKRLSNKIIVLIHGLTNLETIWDFKSELTTNEESQNSNFDPQDNIAKDDHYDGVIIKDNYGLRIQESYGFTPFYLRYNTGLSIKENGQKLNALLTQLQNAYPIEIDEIVSVSYTHLTLPTKA